MEHWVLGLVVGTGAAQSGALFPLSIWEFLELLLYVVHPDHVLGSGRRNPTHLVPHFPSYICSSTSKSFPVEWWPVEGSLLRWQSGLRMFVYLIIVIMVSCQLCSSGNKGGKEPANFMGQWKGTFLAWRHSTFKFQRKQWRCESFSKKRSFIIENIR